MVRRAVELGVVPISRERTGHCCSHDTPRGSALITHLRAWQHIRAQNLSPVCSAYLRSCCHQALLECCKCVPWILLCGVHSAVILSAIPHWWVSSCDGVAVMQQLSSMCSSDNISHSRKMSCDLPHCAISWWSGCRFSTSHDALCEVYSTWLHSDVFIHLCVKWIALLWLLCLYHSWL